MGVSGDPSSPVWHSRPFGPLTMESHVDQHMSYAMEWRSYCSCFAPSGFLSSFIRCSVVPSTPAGAARASCGVNRTRRQGRAEWVLTCINCVLKLHCKSMPNNQLANCDSLISRLAYFTLSHYPRDSFRLIRSRPVLLSDNIQTVYANADGLPRCQFS
jgi:hypothetical protein